MLQSPAKEFHRFFKHNTTWCISITKTANPPKRVRLGREIPSRAYLMKFIECYSVIYWSWQNEWT